MFKFTNLLYSISPLVTRTAKYQNYVKSQALSQLDSHCEGCYPPPEPRQRKVTVVGATSDVGQMASLFLKQQNVIKTLALYDDTPNCLGVGSDLAHIDTSTAVEAYLGKTFKRNALLGADVVLICGSTSCCNEDDRVVFLRNMHLVRTTTIAVTKFCPNAVIAIQSPPVDSNFALCAHTLKGLQAYDKRRVLGVNEVNAMRANQLYSTLTGSDPAKCNIPVVGGCSRCTRVPVFSVANPCKVPKEKLDCITRLVREADDIIYRVKSDDKGGFLSIGFATARFVVNIMKGLFEKPTFLDSAFVEQNDPDKSYGLQYCATPVTVGRCGIVEYSIPNLNEYEQGLLNYSRCDLEDLLNLGRCYATGDEYYVHTCKYCCSDP